MIKLLTVIRTYFVLITIFISTAVSAERISCYVIKNDGDTVNLTLKLSLTPFYKASIGESGYKPDISSLQNRIICYNSKDTKYVLYPTQIQEFGFTYDNIEYRFLSKKTGGRADQIDARAFYLLEMDGYLKLLTAFISKGRAPTSSGIPGGSYLVERHFFQKGGKELMMINPVFFKNVCADYFSDCPELVGLINAKEFRKDDLYEIVNFYNNWIEHKK